jgi:excisionase family DNA binding protein
MLELQNLPDFIKLEISKSDLLDFARVLAQELHRPSALPNPETREIVDLSEAVAITGLARPTLYTLTSRRGIPHFKRGKKLYFKRSELEAWLLQNRRKTLAEIKTEAANVPVRKKGGRHGQ